MKLFKRIAAAFVAISLLSSCSILGNLTQSATQQGNTTGSALAAIFNVLKTNGNIDQSVFTGPAAKAYANGSRAVPTTDTGVAATMGALNSLLNTLK